MTAKQKKDETQSRVLSLLVTLFVLFDLAVAFGSFLHREDFMWLWWGLHAIGFFGFVAIKCVGLIFDYIDNPLTYNAATAANSPETVPLDDYMNAYHPSVKSTPADANKDREANEPKKPTGTMDKELNRVEWGEWKDR